MAALRLPNSRHRSMAEGPQDPRVSMATGAKARAFAETSCAYLILLPCSAFEAAKPAPVADWATWEGARVSGQVKSQTSGLPLDHGSSVIIIFIIIIIIII